MFHPKLIAMSSNLNFLKGKGVLVGKLSTARKSNTKRIVAVLASMILMGAGVGWAQVTYTLGNTGYYTLFNDNSNYIAGINSGTELQMEARGGSKQVVAWRQFQTNGTNSGSSRNLQVGDIFTIQVYATAAYGQMGVSLNASPSTGSWANRHSNSRLYIQADGTGGSWYVNSAAGNQSLTYNVSSTPRDYQFRIYITSEKTCDVELYVNGGLHSSLNNLSLNGSPGANISHFTLYLNDDWNGVGNSAVYWKQTTTHNAAGSVNLGYSLGSSSTYTPGLITDGKTSTSTSSSNANAVNIGGNAGSQVNLTENNTYTGSTTINANAQGEVQHANALGATSAGTAVTSGGSLKLLSASSLTIADEPLTINGYGLHINGTDLGALRSVGGTNTWTGNITLAGSSRINADISGGAGSLSITGNVNCGANTLYLGSRASSLANISISGQISGTGGSIYKDFGNTLTLTGQNSYTGNTTVSAGTLQLNRTGGTTIPNSNDINVSGGTLKVSQNQELDDLTISSGGTLIIDAGVTLTINGVFTGGGTIQNNGSLILKGNSTFPGASSTITSMTNLNINRAAGVTLDKDITITGTLTLTSGKLTTGNNTLYISNSATNALSGGSSSSYIVGNLKRAVAGTGNYVFPIGTSNNYSEASITFTTGYISADLTATYDATSVTTINSPLTSNGQSLIGALNGGFWTITPSAATGSPVYNITINKTDYTNSQGNSNVYTIIKRVTGSGNSWTVQGSHVGNASPLTGTTITSTRNGLTSFSDFTIAYSGSPLPVTFTSLTGNIRNGQAQLNWTIADEHNVDHYQVEESNNGMQFRNLTQVDASNRSAYQASDASLNAGANFYRVKAVDIDGKLTYSKIIRLENSAIDQQIRVYPNPSQGELTLGLNIAAGNYQIRVINAVGQIVLQQPLTHEGGSRSLPLALPKLNAGIYQLEVRGGMQKYVRSVRID